MNPVRLSVLFILVILFIYVGSCRRVGMWLVKKDEFVHADAIVILMGSIPDRILHAVDLYKNARADKVLLVESGMDSFRELEERGADIISSSEQARNAAIDLGIPAGNIILLKGNARSTIDEAFIVREYLSENRAADTILLVSSAHHTRRTYMIFKSVFSNKKEPVYIYCSPSIYSAFDAKKWWRSKMGIQTVLLEYLKMTNFIMFEKSKL